MVIRIGKIWTMDQRFGPKTNDHCPGQLTINH